MKRATAERSCCEAAGRWRDVPNRAGDGMAYLLICDLNGRSVARRKINRYLRQNAQMVQRSVWRFRNYGAMLVAAERVLTAGGRVLAFFESDRILFELMEIRQLLRVS